MRDQHPHDKSHLTDKDHIVKCATSLLANTHQVIQNSAIQGLSLALGSLTAVGVGVGIGALREYRFQLSHEYRQEELKHTIETAEFAYLEIHKNYAVMCMAYQTRIQQLKSKHPFDEIAYRQIMDLWLATERYYQNHIQTHQKNIANISATHQRIHSSRRLDRAMDILNTFLTLTAFGGPPCLLAGAIIRTFAGAGVTLSNLVIHDTAKFNHGIRQEHSIVLLSDQNSINDAIEVLGHTVNPYIGLSGPILRTQKIAGYNVDMLFNTHAGLAKKIVKQAHNRLSCAFSFLNDLPEVPKANVDLPLLPPELRKHNLKLLQQLQEITSNLITEADYLWFLAWGHRQQSKTWAYVVNFQDLINALIDTSNMIHQQMTIIANQIGELNDKTLKEHQVMASLEQKITYLQTLCTTDLKHQLSELQKTPHQVMFNEGLIINLQFATPESIQHIHQTYYMHPEARLNWLNEITFHLNAMNQLINTCLMINGTRYIQNLNEVVLERRLHLNILRQIYTEHEDTHFSSDELALFDRADNLTHRITIQSQLLMKRREQHIVHDPAVINNAQTRYVELIKLQHQRLLGNRVTSSILEESKNPIHVSLRFLSHLESRLTQPTPIHLNTLESTTIVSPNRTFFGLTKHQDIKRDVVAKLEQLSKNAKGPLVLEIMPLQGVDEQILAACQSNYQRFKDLIEGLKTEVQWVAKFKEESAERHIAIANIDEINAYYESQLALFRKVSQDKPTLLGTPLSSSSFFSKMTTYKTQVQNSLHENVFHDADVEMTKMERLLDNASLKFSTDKSF